MTIELSKALFQQNLNTRFQFRDEAGEHVLELVEVSGESNSPKFEYFSLVFRGESNKVLAQRTYQAQHDAMGAFDLFITPIGRSEQGTMYQAVFNRLLDRG